MNLLNMNLLNPQIIIWIFIVLLLLIFTGYLCYIIYLTIWNKEGFQHDPDPMYNRLKGITNICSPLDADYNSPECIDISYSDYDNKVRQVKAILDPGYGVDPNTGFVKYMGGLPTKPAYHTNPAGSEFVRYYTNGPDTPNGYTPIPIPTMGTFNPNKKKRQR
jgi:hypothetical protein